jgi:CRP/FNR family transcriptional regulator, cyclic AMP receptor protein
MPRRTSVIESMARIPMFTACTKRELQAISKLTTQQTVAAGRELTKEGQGGSEFAIILEGTAVATRKGREIARLGPGDYYGEIALLDPGVRTATVTAETPMTLAVLTPSEFTQALDEVPTLAHKILRGLARRIHELSAEEHV